jgi:hypothetical protein
VTGHAATVALGSDHHDRANFVDPLRQSTGPVGAGDAAAVA